jgi:hypothetical protein
MNQRATPLIPIGASWPGREALNEISASQKKLKSLPWNFATRSDEGHAPAPRVANPHTLAAVGVAAGCRNWRAPTESAPTAQANTGEPLKK